MRRSGNDAGLRLWLTRPTGGRMGKAYRFLLTLLAYIHVGKACMPITSLTESRLVL